jgi:hypothetical protein
MTPQYRNGRKLSPREIADFPNMTAIMQLNIEQGRVVMRLL